MDLHAGGKCAEELSEIGPVTSAECQNHGRQTEGTVVHDVRVNCLGSGWVCHAQVVVQQHWRQWQLNNTAYTQQHALHFFCTLY